MDMLGFIVIQKNSVVLKHAHVNLMVIEFACKIRRFKTF